MTLKTTELQLGDVVRQLGHIDAFNTCVVVSISATICPATGKSGAVHLFRPYAITSDFSHTGGVIPYVGIETYSVEFERSTEWELLTRKTVK